MSKVERITVIGMGTMGNGIAHVAAQNGFEVVLNDVDDGAIERGRSTIERNLNKGIERGKVTESERDATLARLSPETNLGKAVASADLVIEAVPESIELKQSILRQVEASAPSHAILASNTSSLPISSLAAATSCPDRVLGMHFFNPVHLMALLEIVKGDATSQDVLDRTLDVSAQMKKEAIVVRDSPGFATSRLGLVIGLEAIRMVEEEVASPEDIDKAMSLGYRHPMGPLKLTDLVGLDVRLAIAEHLHRELKSEGFRPPELLRKMVAEGKLGKKSGQGFYRWDRG